MAGIFWFQIHFSIGNRMDRVHGSWTTGGTGPRWTQNRGGGGGSPELLLPAGTGHNDSSQGGENEEELTGVQF
jgi:hypothetical protein